MSKGDELAKEIAGLDSSFIDELYNLQIPDEKTSLSEVITLGTTPVSEEHSKEVKSSIVENQLEETVPNTYGDLHDAPVEYIEILSSGKVGETTTIPQDTVITSLDNLLFGRAPEVIREEVGDSFWNLADFIDKMPHGIVDKKIDQALDGVEEISKHVDALLVINNEKLSEIYSELSVDDAFDKADDTLSVAAKSIAEIITLHGKVNLDFNDVKTVLKDGGVAIMSTGYGEGENRVSEAIKNAQHSPLLNNNDIFNSKKVLLNISYSAQYKLMMSEMDEVKEFMNRFSRDFETKFGMAIDDKLEQKVKITLLATGFGIQDIHMKEMDDRITQRTAEEQQRLAELEEEEEQRRNRREVYYGKDANARSQRSRRRHIYLFNPEDMDNADIISMVENSPTYLRDKSTLNSIKMKAEQEGQLATEAAQEAEGGAGGVITF